MAFELLVILAVLLVGILMAVVFAIALALKIVGGTIRLVTGACFRRPRRRLLESSERCTRDGCGAANPPQARFCRRCGRALSAQSSTAAPVRRIAACW